MRSIFIFLIINTFLFAQNPDKFWETYYEKSGFKETPPYAETVKYCQQLASVSPMIHYTSFGTSPQGRDLPLLIVDKNGNFTPEKVRQTNNAVIMIQAGIHSGEIDGKDAGLMLIRNMVIFRQNIELLDNVTILFIPIFNVDGHERSGPYNRINQNGPEEMGWRTTAQNYNLNRDYLKADSPEMHGFLELFNEWLPDFFVDCHVTDGADYQYTVTYALETMGVQNDSIMVWSKNVYLNELFTKMETDGFPIIDYISFRKWNDPRSGLEGSVSKPRYSTGYTSLQNRPGLLIETHMLKDYKTRVNGTYAMLENTLKILNSEHARLKQLIAAADNRVQQKEFREQTFPLSYKLTGDSTIIDFLGYEYTVEKSDLSGGNWFRYSKTPVTYKLPYFDFIEVEETTKLPEAYIIPVEWTDIISRIELHGIEFKRLQDDHKVKVKSFKFSNVKWAQIPFEHHHNVTFDIEEIEQERAYPMGSVIIPMSQRRAKVIANILEPEAPDSYVFWGFFDPIFERKEYAEAYVMEEIARFMLASDEDLKKEFEDKKATDKEFAGNPEEILDWFYQRSPYWDKKLYIYPVGKIFDSNVLNNLLK